MKNILSWLKTRLLEPSTWQGIITLLGAIGVAVDPSLIEQISITAVSIIGLIEVIKKDPKTIITEDKEKEKPKEDEK